MATVHLPDGTEFAVEAKLTGEVRWTAANRKLLRERSGVLQGFICEIETAARLGISVRTVRERARARAIGRKISRVRWFTEDEVIALMENSTCSNSSSGHVRLSGTSGARSTDELFTRLQRRETKQMLADLRTNLKSGSLAPPAKNVTPLHSKKPLPNT
jgi:hypothetical protein